MVTMITLVPGQSCLMARVAARPSRSGMRTSISTRSGRRWRHKARASRPVVASPTMCRRGSVDSKLARPARVRSWSSTITTRFGELGRAVAASGGIEVGSFRHDRHVDPHPGAHAGTTCHQTPTPQQRDALLHARQTDTLAWPVSDHGSWPEAAPPVLDRQPDTPSTARQANIYVGRPGVLAHVSQRFLSDAE